MTRICENNGNHFGLFRALCALPLKQAVFSFSVCVFEFVCQTLFAIYEGGIVRRWMKNLAVVLKRNRRYS